MALQLLTKHLAARVCPLRLGGRRCPSALAGYGVAGYANAARVAGTTAVAPSLRSDHEPAERREPVLRVNQGSVKLVGALRECANEDDDLQLELLGAVPQIDKSSFRDYIEIPAHGIRSLISQDNLRILANGVIPFKRYVEGSQSAHHYPLSLLPRKLSAKLGGDIMVTSFAVHEKDYCVEGARRVRLSVVPTLKVHPNEVLLQKLYGRPSVLIVFSGDLPYADAKGAMDWAGALTFDVRTHMVLNAPCPVGMSYFYKRYLKSLAGALVERHSFSCISRKLKDDETIAFHQYRRQFTSLLLLDRFGYIRWHAVGKPTREAVYLLKEAHEKLVQET